MFKQRLKKTGLFIYTMSYRPITIIINTAVSNENGGCAGAMQVSDGPFGPAPAPALHHRLAFQHVFHRIACFYRLWSYEPLAHVSIRLSYTSTIHFSLCKTFFNKQKLLSVPLSKDPPTNHAT